MCVASPVGFAQRIFSIPIHCADFVLIQDFRARRVGVPDLPSLALPSLAGRLPGSPVCSFDSRDSLGGQRIFRVKLCINTARRGVSSRPVWPVKKDVPLPPRRIDCARRVLSAAGVVEKELDAVLPPMPSCLIGVP